MIGPENMSKKEIQTKKDVRKITEYFRAVEKDTDPTTFYGHLISDDGFNVVCFSSHDKESSHLKERVLEKREHNFTKINIMEFEYHARKAIFTMKEDSSDKKFLFEAAQHNCDFAEQKLYELVKK